eukprot:GHVS01036608.1.p1 GENE.GHVS01036608.1~~GHVS01036608.1.p1  ORF type:complete len:101 (+),score=5.56 GHVS01036608.1:559-861(+)
MVSEPGVENLQENVKKWIGLSTVRKSATGTKSEVVVENHYRRAKRNCRRRASRTLDQLARYIKCHQLGVEVFRFIAEARMATPLARRVAEVQGYEQIVLP